MTLLLDTWPVVAAIGRSENHSAAAPPCWNPPTVPTIVIVKVGWLVEVRPSSPDSFGAPARRSPIALRIDCSSLISAARPASAAWSAWLRVAAISSSMPWPGSHLTISAPHAAVSATPWSQALLLGEVGEGLGRFRAAGPGLRGDHDRGLRTAVPGLVGGWRQAPRQLSRFVVATLRARLPAYAQLRVV